MVLVNNIDGNPIKRLTGFQYQKCVSGITDLKDGGIAFTRFEYNNNFIVPRLPLDSIAAISNVSDFKGLEYPNVATKGVFKSLIINIKGKNILLEVANTKGNTIVIMDF